MSISKEDIEDITPSPWERLNGFRNLFLDPSNTDDLKKMSSKVSPRIDEEVEACEITITNNINECMEINVEQSASKMQSATKIQSLFPCDESADLQAIWQILVTGFEVNI